MFAINTQTYFRLCLVVPVLVPLPFVFLKGDEGLSSMFMAQLAFGIPPYFLFIAIPLLYFFGKMSERQIVISLLFFPVAYPLVFWLFWTIAPNFITTMTISLSNTSQWLFTSIMFPLAYSSLFLMGNIIRKMISGEMGLLEQRVVPVLCADIKGNTKSLNEYQTSLKEIISEHRGQRTNLASDNIIVEFGSVLNAVQCGLSLQKKIKEINQTRSADENIQLGIGINLGEVKTKGDAIHGRGVAIATQLEDLAQGGDICISGDVYDRIRRKLIFNYEYLGEKTLDSIDIPVRVYYLQLESTIPASQAKTEIKLTIPDKPSIAVLPFDNMSADPEQEYFSDGISEDILTDLSKLSGLFVISRNSSFVYKGKSVNVRQVSQELGVRYVLEGSVRKAGNRIRITAQLIDALNDDHVWADRFDRDLDDIFAVQDEVSKKIVEALKINLSGLEKQRLGHAGTKNVEASDLALRAAHKFNTYTPENLKEGIELISRAIELDPNFAEAYAIKTRLVMFPYITNTFSVPDDTLETALALARKAVELDDLLPVGHATLGWALMWNQEIDEAIIEVKKGVELDPNNDRSYMWQSMILSSAGKGKEAMEAIERAMRLNPYYEVVFIYSKGMAYFAMDEYENAISQFQQGIQMNAHFMPNYLMMITALAILGKKDEVRMTYEKILQINPDFHRINVYYFNDKRLREILIDAYDKVGQYVPEYASD